MKIQELLKYPTEKLEGLTDQELKDLIGPLVIEPQVKEKPKKKTKKDDEAEQLKQLIALINQKIKEKNEQN